ncbi:MAG: pilus assembly protein [Pseudomonadota bacterium]
MASLLVAGGAVLPVHADDIEIFRGAASDQSSVPNILMVVDTSGSMGFKDVPYVSEPYDHSKTYSGSTPTDNWYALVNCGNSGGCDAHRMDKTINQCDALEQELTTRGEFEGNLARLMEGENTVIEEEQCETVCTRYVWGSCVRTETTCETVEVPVNEPSQWLPVGPNHDDDEVVYDCERDQVIDDTYAARNGTFDESTGGQLLNDAYTSSEDPEDQLNWNFADYNAKVVTGNYINWKRIQDANEGRTITRMEAVQNVLVDVINSMDNVNFGLMSFDPSGGAQGGIVNYPVSFVNDHRDDLLDKVDDYWTSGGTPLQETLYETLRYWRGDTPYYGRHFREDERDPHDDAFTNSSRNNYKSPIANECQANATLLLTDGAPSVDGDNGPNGVINTILNKNGANRCGRYEDDGGDMVRHCLPEVAQYMFEYDMRGDLEGDQVSEVYTVGFKSDQDLLQDTASRGSGQYFTANDTVQLTQALKDIIRKVKSESATFTTPGVAVNNYGRLTNREEIYYALFLPKDTERWGGNLKRYKITDDGVIVDRDDTPAIDASTGFFDGDARSFWSNATDGNEVEKGGASSRQDAPRQVFTYLGNTPPDGVNLAQGNQHLLSPSNSLITQPMLQVGSAAARNQSLAWGQGFDTEDEDGDGSKSDTYGYVGDPLHSSPTLITYRQDETTQDATVFFGTNEGFIHGVDAETGREKFAFMPEELLKNLNVYREDKNATVLNTKTYGMDAEIAVWINDLNRDGNLHNSDGTVQNEGSAETRESAYIFAGMRRGGRSYYAMDVTVPESPQLVWHISGDDSLYPDWDIDPALEELGQTWAKPVVSLVKWGGEDGEPRVVLFFTGGYDNSQDTATALQKDDMGRAVFMVDAKTGELLWSAGPDDNHDLKLEDMNYSLPGTPTLADMDGDGYVDLLFAGDTGGNIWRFDFNNESKDSDFEATGGRIAAFAEAGAPRRFFTSPDLSVVQKAGSDPYLAVAMGTGRRPNPLNTSIQDSFFVIKQKDLMGPPTDSDGDIAYATITRDDLYNTTGKNIANLSDEEQVEELDKLSKADGWYLDFTGEGEKVLGSSLTFDGQVIFNTFSPTGRASGCGPDTGMNRLYVRDVMSGSTSIASNDSSLDSVVLQQPGIAPEPTVLFMRRVDGDGNVTQVPQVVVGTEVIKDEDGCGIFDKACRSEESGDEASGENTGARVQFWYEKK